MILRSIKGIMLVTGGLTCTMIYAVIAPHAMLQSTFGETVDGPLATLLARNWGALIVLVGAMLIYGAFNPAVRPLVLAVAAASKAIFIGLLLSHGTRYLGGPAIVPVIVDTLMVVMFTVYLVTAPKAPGTHS